MDHLEIATCDRAAPIAEGGKPTTWVHLLPDGKMMGRDGREFDLVDPKALLEAFREANVDLPVDYEHQSENPDAKLSGPVPAAGWIKELKIAANGIWGRVGWTAKAGEMIASQEYRYLSPTFLFNPITKAIVKLKGAGLVHNPNLLLTALSSQENQMSQDTAFTGKLAAAIGLPADTAPEEILKAVHRVMQVLAASVGKKTGDTATMAELVEAVSFTDPTKFAPVNVVQGLLAERNQNIATMAEKKAGDRVRDAMDKGYLSPAMMSWATALCMKDEGSFDTFMASSVPHFKGLFEPIKYTTLSTEAAQGGAGDPAAAVCSQLGLPAGTLKN